MTDAEGIAEIRKSYDIYGMGKMLYCDLDYMFSYIGILESRLAKAQAAGFHAGVIAGMRRFAWWKDGVQQVGTCGTTLAKAIRDWNKEDTHVAAEG